MIGSVSFQAQGREMTLRFSAGAMCRIEERAKRAFSEIVNRMSSGEISISDIRLLLGMGCGMADVAKAEAIIDELGMPAVVELVGRAVAEAFPDPSDAGNGRTPA